MNRQPVRKSSLVQIERNEIQGHGSARIRRTDGARIGLVVLVSEADTSTGVVQNPGTRIDLGHRYGDLVQRQWVARDQCREIPNTSGK
jgi:hypothetical protein